MDNYRKKPTRRHTRQAIDGILNAPVNRMNQAPQAAKRAKDTRAQDSFQSSRRTKQIGDFTNLKEGYHSSDQTTDGRLSAQPKKQKHVAQSQAIRKSLAVTEVEEQELSRRQRRKQARAHKKQAKKQRKGFRKWLPRVLIVLGILLIIGIGFLLVKGYIKLSNVLQGGGHSAALSSEVDPSKLQKEGDGRINILVIGGRDDDDPDGGGLTDTMLVASVDPVNHKMALISVPRDLWVKTESSGSERINAVFKYGRQNALSAGKSESEANTAGAQALKKKMTEVLGIDLNYYVMVDMNGFTKAVDTIGGVSINVPEAVYDATMAWQNGGRSLLVPAGQQTLDAKHALFYVQSRKGDPKSDFGRSERQRLFIAAFMKEVMSASTFSNPLTISRLMDDFGNHVRTDFAVNDLTSLYSIMSKTSEPESIGLTNENYLTSASIGGRSVLVPKAGTFDYSEIQAYIHTALPDGYILKENAPVVVLNGTTTAGVATETADLLKSYAYNVTKTDNAPTQTYTKTVIIDLTGKNPYTKNYLEKRFGVTATAKLPDGLTVADENRQGFIIIIGEDNI